MNCTKTAYKNLYGNLNLKFVKLGLSERAENSKAFILLYESFRDGYWAYKCWYQHLL